MKRIILGITGLNGSGKSTVARYLQDEKGFYYLSFRSFLLGKLNDKGIEANRESMRLLANELRKKHGADYILEEMLKEALESNREVVIESIRAIKEADYLKNRGVKLLAVTAPADIRYQRIYDRGSETDQVTYKEFLQGEARESQSEDPDVQNLPKVVARADYIITNDDLPTLKKDIDILIQQMKNL